MQLAVGPLDLVSRKVDSVNDLALVEPALTDDQRADLLARWSEPQRRYHTLDHLRQVLHSLELLSQGGVDFDPVPVRLAAWFHDAIYEIPGTDNEARSAELASEMLTGQSLGDEVARLVIVTATHHVRPDDANAAALCDADLSILAGSREQYTVYRQQVREEYAAVPDEHFCVGRAAVLQSLLTQDTLFHTDVGLELWEARARDNVTTEIRDLEQLSFSFR
ncbi:hypothetical protein ACPXCG_17950 [Gordonia sp. DT218]|uniref:HD domain-containing protein n=1 Tax=Gordonia sp. DT218 TaxID=3416659 RepID=UPI003CF92D72